MTFVEDMRHAPLTLNSMLMASDIRPEEVLVFRHRPYEPALNRVFNSIVEERPDLFACYQDTHGPRTEAALLRARYLAAFVRYGPGAALFVGLYKVASWKKLTVEECTQRPAHQELMAMGMVGFKSTESREEVVQFDLPITSWHAEWHGRLIIRWPGLERSWYRWADRNEFLVEAIAQESVLVGQMPPWDQLVLDWKELSVLPEIWRAALKHWRGIYLIIDRTDGKQYVGSAYGAENILQRWLEYARSGHGGNKHLRLRDPHNFRFSILQRVAPDLDDATVIAVEKTWKERLGTRAPAGLNEN